MKTITVRLTEYEIEYIDVIIKEFQKSDIKLSQSEAVRIALLRTARNIKNNTDY